MLVKKASKPTEQKSKRSGTTLPSPENNKENPIICRHGRLARKMCWALQHLTRTNYGHSKKPKHAIQMDPGSGASLQWNKTSLSQRTHTDPRLLIAICHTLWRQQCRRRRHVNTNCQWYRKSHRLLFVQTNCHTKKIIHYRKRMPSRNSLENFKKYFDGTHVTVSTDHASLIWLNRFKESNGRLIRWALRLQKFVIELKHKKGKDMKVPDALSRIHDASSNRLWKFRWFDRNDIQKTKSARK